MTSSSFPGDQGAAIVTDASVIINLVATRAAADIVVSFPNRFLATANVRRELWEGRGRGHGSWEGLEALIGDGSIEPVQLQGGDESVYRSLVEGDARETLDDGEAATIAYAVGRAAVALIDERKARRICAGRFPGLRLALTVDLLLHGLVRDVLGGTGQKDAIFRALRDAKMQVVPPDRMQELVRRIGPVRAAVCTSLPEWVRTPPEGDVRRGSRPTGSSSWRSCAPGSSGSGTGCRARCSATA